MMCGSTGSSMEKLYSWPDMPVFRSTFVRCCFDWIWCLCGGALLSLSGRELEDLFGMRVVWYMVIGELYLLR